MVEQNNNAILLEVTIKKNGGILAPEELGDLLKTTTHALEAAGYDPSGGSEGLVVSGRLPIWAAAAILHEHGHARPWAATFDPRLAGGVVTMSHTHHVQVGDVIPVNPQLAKVEANLEEPSLMLEGLNL